MIDVLAVTLAYILPSCIAYSRRHYGTNAIVVVNVFLGWTLLMWFICLVWSLNGNTPHKK